MDKRGVEQESFLLIELILGIIVAGLFVYIAMNPGEVANGDILFLKNDLPLMVESIKSSPGTVVYHYPFEKEYQAIVGEQTTVSRRDVPLGTGSSYNLTLTKREGSPAVVVGYES